MKIHIIFGLVVVSFILVQCVTGKPVGDVDWIFRPIAASSSMKERDNINDGPEMRHPIAVRQTINVLVI